jgi:prepilin peptidase CpaA
MTYAAYLLVDLFPVSLLLAAISDLRTMTIPNRLCLFLAVAFFPAALLAGLSADQWMSCVGMGLAGFAVGIALFACRLMGGGDAKLIAAASLWIGFAGGLHFIYYTAVAGGLMAVFLLLTRKVGQFYTPFLPKWIGRHLEAKGDLPYGVAICAGGIMAIPQSPLRHLFGFA